MTGDPRRLPAVHAVLDDETARDAASRWGRERVAAAVDAVLDRLRGQILSGAWVDERQLEAAAVARRAAVCLDAMGRRRQVPVINATGVIIHTNLGRSVLSDRAREAVADAAGSYTNLELDLDTGERGSRQALVEDLLCYLTGARAALVVNNNAAAVLLALRVLASGREAIVSRGQLVEIGGSFRVPDVMAESGARLVEVGTTNRTHIADYRRAIGPDTALLLSVHPSNYRVTGFTAEVDGEDLVALGRERNVPVMFDLGSGALVAPPGVDEPEVGDVVATGYDVVTFSGDKVLGGPQGGILLGSESVIGGCRSHPLMRALRPDKLQLAALEATLAHYITPGEALCRVPTLVMMAADPADLKERAQELARNINGLVPSIWRVGVDETCSRVGGGALPGRDLQGYAAWIEAAGREGALAAALRRGDPPVIGRVQAGRLILDPRTLLPGQEDVVVQAFRSLTLD